MKKSQSGSPQKAANDPSGEPGNSTHRLARAVAALPAPLAVVGFGVEGRETHAFLLRQGVAGVRVFDRAFDGAAIAALNEEFPQSRFLGGEDWGAPLQECATVFRGPGVRPDLPALQRARAGGARLSSATALFLQLFAGRCVGVTGTVGKGTTASLIGKALEAGGVAHRLGGNIGLNPLAFLAETTAQTTAVLELSSFQLMALQGRRPEVAVVLRTSSEHMDWHRDLAEYRAAKQGLLAPADEAQRVIFCADSEGSAQVVAPRRGGALAVSLASAVENGVGMAGGRLARFRDGVATALPELDHPALPGRFNLENAAAAYLAAEALGAPTGPALKAIAEFPGLPHRLERVGQIEGVACYNDSYATRPEATLGALSAFDASLALILGGSEKHADFGPLAEALCRHPTLRRVVLIGATAARLAQEISAAATRLAIPGPPVKRAATLAQAYRTAREALPDGGVLLFSPACASFDMFENYKVRGEQFRALVG